MNTLEANVYTITSSTPSPVMSRSIVSQVAAKHPACKGLLNMEKYRIHGEMDEIVPDHGKVLKF